MYLYSIQLKPIIVSCSNRDLSTVTLLNTIPAHFTLSLGYQTDYFYTMGEYTHTNRRMPTLVIHIYIRNKFTFEHRIKLVTKMGAGLQSYTRIPS